MPSESNSSSNSNIGSEELFSAEEGSRSDGEASFSESAPVGGDPLVEASQETTAILHEEMMRGGESGSDSNEENKNRLQEAREALQERMQGLRPGTFTEEDQAWLDSHKHEYGDFLTRLQTKVRNGELDKTTDLTPFAVKCLLLTLRDAGQFKPARKNNPNYYAKFGRAPKPPSQGSGRKRAPRSADQPYHESDSLLGNQSPENSPPTPPKYTIPNTLISQVFFWVTVGKATGQLAILIQATIKGGFNKEKIERFIFTNPNIMKRWPAWGVVAGLGMAAIATTIDAIRQYRHSQQNTHRAGYTNFPSGNSNEKPDEAYEYKRYWYLPSTTSLFTLGARAFMVQQAVRLLASAYMGEKFSPFVGDVFSPAVGALAMPLAMIHFPSLARGLARCCSRLETQLIESRRWYKEARPDVPWYARLLVAGCIAFTSAYLMYDASADNFAARRFNLTWSSFILVWAVPPLWEALRTGIIDFRRGEPAGSNHANFALPGASLLSQIDFPNYVKLMSGLLTADVFRSSVQGYVGKGNAIGDRGYWVAGAILLPFISGIAFRIARGIKNACASSRPSRLETPPPPRLDVDMTLAMHAASGSMAGLTLGSAFVLMLSTTMNRKLELAIVCSMTALAILAPLVRPKFVSCFPRVGRFFGLSPAPAANDTKEKAHLELPFQVNAFMGGWAGALIGGMLGVFFSNIGDPGKVQPVYLGLPDLMRVSDAVGAPKGAVIGALAGMFWPLLIQGGKKALTSCSSRMFSKCEKSRDDEEHAYAGHNPISF